jgi:hypothetical protein
VKSLLAGSIYTNMYALLISSSLIRIDMLISCDPLFIGSQCFLADTRMQTSTRFWDDFEFSQKLEDISSPRKAPPQPWINSVAVCCRL